MEIIGTDVSEMEQKNKKMMNIIIILIVIVLLISFGIMGAIYYLQKTQFKFLIDGQEPISYAEDLFIFEDENVYISIKDMATLVGYRAYNGAYGSQAQYSEDNTKCYVESGNEIASFELNSNKIYKTQPNEMNNYEYFDIDEPVKQINNKLYTTVQGISKAYNISFLYNKDNNQITIYTLPYLVNYYSTNVPNSSISTNFNNQKALLYNLIIVTNQTATTTSANVRYGISSLSNVEIVGTKYTNIEFIESTQEFLVTTTEGKIGIITSSGDTKIQPQYDDLKQIDKDLNLYLATNDNKQGIIEKSGKTLIYLEYDKIGIDADQFPDDDIKNPYLLYGNCIPVQQNGKWGIFDKTGNLIVPIEYDNLGCKVNSTTYNSILLIPNIEGIVVCTNYNDERYLYGVIDSLGKQIIPMVLDSVYSITSSGVKEYKMTNAGRTLDVIEYYMSKKSET